jgi:hypothetical protein
MLPAPDNRFSHNITLRRSETMLKQIFVALVTAGLVYGSQMALASDRDLRATTVPATACEPLNSTQANTVWLSNAAWVFRGNNTGTVTFYCPLPRNAVTLSDNTDDNDITVYRVYYRDSDGAGPAARVTTRLVYRRSTGLFAAGSTWSSNSHNATDNTVALFANAHDMRFDAVYSFLVTLQRTNIQQDPAFSGIDFTFEPIP